MHGAFAPSRKSIPLRERLIFALDVGSAEEACALVERLGDSVNFYKLGLEFFMAGGCFEFLSWLHQREKKAFVDLKFFDVPNTVGSAVRALRSTSDRREQRERSVLRRWRRRSMRRREWQSPTRSI